MKLTKATINKLRKESPTRIGKELGTSRQNVMGWLSYGSIPDKYIVTLKTVVDFKILGKWADGQRELCPNCSCERVCKG